MCIKQFCYGKVINEMEHLDIHGRKKLLTGACYRAKIECSFVLSFQPDLTVYDTACYIMLKWIHTMGAYNIK